MPGPPSRFGVLARSTGRDAGLDEGDAAPAGDDLGRAEEVGPGRDGGRGS